MPFSRGSHNPEIEPRSPELQVVSLSAELLGKHVLGNKNILNNSQ